MTEREWTEQDTDFRARLLNSLPDAEGIDPDTPWEQLPYWLRRFITYFVIKE